MEPSSGKAAFLDLPDEILVSILAMCTVNENVAVSKTCVRLGAVVHSNFDIPEPVTTTLDALPSEVLLGIFAYFDMKDLGRTARVNRRFRDLVYADCLWMRPASSSIVTNASDPSMSERTKQPLASARDRVRVSANWQHGIYAESKLLVQNVRYMPRMQLEREVLWVSWGNRIWAHPRGKDGQVGRTTTRALKGHTDDVSRFVVKDGLLVSGGRDRTLVCWDSVSGEFLFAKRYCHGSEVSAVDVVRADYSQQTIVTGSRDGTAKLWTLSHDAENQMQHSNMNSNNNNNNNRFHQHQHHYDNFPALETTIHLGDRIWSLAADPSGSRIAIGSAGLGGVPALHLLNLEIAGVAGSLVPMGQGDLRKGAGMLDLKWHTDHTFLGCGYDAYTRLWDTRTGGYVMKWEEPFDEAIYCLSTDNNNTLVCGTARHGLVRLWDMRSPQPVQMYYTKHAHRGQSSPVYSVAFDQANLYVALDQCLNLMSFTGLNNQENSRKKVAVIGRGGRGSKLLA